ncbi:MAG TPA: cytochrome c-type biogenesis protein CcmH [Candidatus Dormibacteraeota bacterium]|nr:cytochrome c-type biogenesis protein CcmH [Candidatus Dormibacteraeota bacterium]
MIKLRSFRAAILFLSAASLPFPALATTAEQPDRAHQIGAKLKCMCGGCSESAGGCYHIGGAFSGPCDTAKSMLKEVSSLLAKGETETQILHGFEQEFGLSVYIEPPKSGFSLLAWIMPFFYLAAGTLLVVFVIHRWSNRPRQQQLAAGGKAPAVSLEYLARARAQSARDTDD